MTEEQQKLLESLVKPIAEQFGAEFSVNLLVDKHSEHKRIVIDYAKQKR